MASGRSEMRALGIVAKFGHVFAKNGGTLDMLSWVTDNPDLMKQIVEIADSRVLEIVSEMTTIKWVELFSYDPAEFLRPGACHHGVRISEKSDDMSAITFGGKRQMRNVSLGRLVLRRDAIASTVYSEVHKRKLTQRMTVDHLWAALVSKSGNALDRTGKANEFHIPDRTTSGVWIFPLHVHNTEDGWILRRFRSIGPNDELAAGMSFMVTDDKT